MSRDPITTFTIYVDENHSITHRSLYGVCSVCSAPMSVAAFPLHYEEHLVEWLEEEVVMAAGTENNPSTQSAGR